MNSRVTRLRKMPKGARGIDGEELQKFTIDQGFVAEVHKDGSRVEVEDLIQEGRALHYKSGCTGQGD